VLTIGEVAARAGLQVSAIRYYERLGLIPTAARRGGKRVYDAAILDRLALIELAKRAGFELTEILEFFARVGDGSPAFEWPKLAEAKHAALDAEIARLTFMQAVLAALRNCGCATLDECGRTFNAARAAMSASVTDRASSRRPRK
jgi:MerR family transcriptional regulator, redox-sensitive transcriptional activator SoxR